MPNKYLTKLFAICLMVTAGVTSCTIGAGTLGSFEDRKFQVSIEEMLVAMNSLESHKIPEKWKPTAASIEGTYGFFENTNFYLKGSPEEMYFVSYQGNSRVTVMSIRSVFKNGKWFIENDLAEDERERIENRFDREIIAKLEKLTNSKATRDE
ncbi:hypothetical protein TH61_07155 [Rufibacter sp. DG15C]|uniref:hypothetical protein n=1 Tax=Rufibacter sp. DG15C TaxID=1379909 RepID=UPI00078DF43E|nr:hypothetical protein [Rufibacter sp. DG15C]AMM51005.1 hypothetical protein TH61_07155 [Rufibacter sp. DG15C]